MAINSDITIETETGKANRRICVQEKTERSSPRKSVQLWCCREVLQQCWCRVYTRCSSVGVECIHAAAVLVRRTGKQAVHAQVEYQQMFSYSINVC